MRSEDLAQRCRLCAIADGGRLLGSIDQPWLESDSYMAFVSVGALVEGWTLVAPRTHALNLTDEYRNDEFVRFVHDTSAVIRKIYGKVVAFEHGSQREASQTSCGTSHAHLHLVPLDCSLSTLAMNFDSTLAWQACAAADIKSIVGLSEYLFVSDNYLEKSAGWLTLLSQGQSQFFRRVIADRLGRPDESNYRTHPQLTTAAISAGALSTAASKRFSAAA